MRSLITLAAALACGTAWADGHGPRSPFNRLPDFVAGAGFAGIAVSLIGRNHPLGIVLASVLFGALFQGGAEVAFEVPGFSRDMVVMLQGFIVLFSGAMAYVIAPWLTRLWNLFRRAPAAVEGARHG